jgi:MoaA/NifB/PqqE/SkfB family radical SAM enzyme
MRPAPLLREVVTNVRCNRACVFCNRRGPVDDPRYIAATAVGARIRTALAAGETRITLTGGEPTMRSDLAQLVSEARAAGATEVSIETNATLIDRPMARRLRDGGLAVARVNLPCWGEALDPITRDPGGFARARAGMDALAAEGIAIDITAAAVRSTLPHLPVLPRRIAEALGEAVRQIEVSVPVEAPDASELLGYEEVATTLQSLAVSAWKAGIPASLNPVHGFPPCVLEPALRARHASLFALPVVARRAAGYCRVEACRECGVAERCPGFSAAYRLRRPIPDVRPVRDEPTLRRLSIPRRAHEQVEEGLVSRSMRADRRGRPVGQSVVRINFHCNQACAFCFVQTQLPPPRAGAIERAIDDAAQRGDYVALSGGEPTLHPRLVEYVRRASRASRRPVTLQTNAVRLDDPLLAAALADAGLDEAFVSLHGAKAKTAEAVTRSPGTFQRTLAGLDNLMAVRVPFSVNFVICGSNASELPDAVEMAAARWPGARFNLSFVSASSQLVPRDRTLIPSYGAVLPHLTASLRTARSHGVRVSGFESMCGLPLCIVPEELEPDSLFDIPPDVDRGDFVKADACATCRLEPKCWGVRGTYAALHGIGELRPLAPLTLRERLARTFLRPHSWSASFRRHFTEGHIINGRR